MDIYFDNDMHAHARRDAVSLRRMLERKGKTSLVAEEQRPSAMKARAARGGSGARRRAER